MPNTYFNVSAQLELVLTASHMGTFYWNFKSGEAEWSEESYKVFGFDGERPKVTYDLYMNAIHPDDRQHVNDLIQKSIKENAILKGEFRTRGKDGKERWVLEYGRIFKDENGQASYMLGTLQDISQKKAEQIDYERNVDESPAMLWITRPDGYCTYLSKQWYQFTGQTLSEGLGYGWLNCVHPDDRQKTSDLFIEANAIQKLLYCEYRLRMKSGEYRWVIDTANPRFDSMGNYLGFAGTILDIHDKKVAEEESAYNEGQAREGQKKLQTLIEMIPQLVWACNPDGTCDYVSKQWATFTGVEREELLGFGWLNKVVHPDDKQPTYEHWRGALEGKNLYDLEYRIRRHDGEYRWFKTRGTPITNSSGAIEYWFGTCTDVHDQKLSHQQSDLIIETIPQGVWRTNPDGSADFFSKNFYELVGYTREEMLEWGWSQVIHPEDRERVLKTWQEARDAQEPVKVDFRVLGKDGKYKWHLSLGNPFFDEKGQLTKYYGTWTDIHTERVQQAQLTRAVKSRDDFLSIASHELKTPLTSLRLSSQIASKLHAKAPDDPKTYQRLAEFADQTDKQINKLNRLVDDMLDVSRIQTGKLAVQLSEVDIVALLKDVLLRMEPQFAKSNIPLPESAISDESIITHVDHGRIEQVFTNLLSNAIRYGLGKPISIFLAKKGSSVEFQVRDQGSGIKKEDLGRIIDKFERAIEAHEVSGLGLGLYISKKIVEAHAGKIWVESKVGVGTTFYVSLPLSRIGKS